MSEAIRRVLGEFDIQTAFKPLASLRNILSHPKDPISQESRSSVIYRIPCADCSRSYVGQTGRNLSQRIREHRRAVDNFDMDTSALAEHANKEDHWIAWKDASVIDQHPVLQSRCSVKSWYINNLPGILNQEKGSLPEAYLSLRTAKDTPISILTTPTNADASGSSCHQRNQSARAMEL